MRRQMWGRVLRLVAALIGVAMYMLGGLGNLVHVEAGRAGGPPLWLHRGMIDGSPAPALAEASPLNSEVRGVAIIQFAGPITPADQAALKGVGVAIIEYIPDYAYLVRGEASALAAAAALSGVYARAPLVAADKLAPSILRSLAAGTISRPIEVNLSGWGTDAQALSAALTRAGIDPARPLSAAQLLALSALAEVRWIEPTFAPHLLNDRGGTIIRVASAWEDHGLYGTGQIVGIADTGLDTGDPATLSPDFAGRIVATHVLSASGTLRDELGHGTHVAGTLAGSGVRSGADPQQRRYGGSFAGVAPEASLVIQAFEVNEQGQLLGGLGNDPYPLLEQAYADGARIHTNSWGGPTGIPFLDPQGYFGGYTSPSRRADEFIWRHPDMAVFFAAGNNGNDGSYYLTGCLPDGDGWIDEDSLLAPGTAKNVITVGASESLRLEGRLSEITWRDFDPSCYGREPLASDLLSNNPNGIAAFSARGPVDDGRIKPDLVAPGTSIVSNRSGHPDANPLWGLYPDNPAYVVSGGTSMATPFVAGAGTLVREWLGRQGHTNPSAAVIKAVLLGTTHDIAPGQYTRGQRQEIPSQRPNSVAGWGRLDLGFLSAPSPYQLWVDDRKSGLTTGQVVTYQHTDGKPLNVTQSDQPLRVTLVWTDPPASLSAARQLVNDLDLLVIGPDGQAYYGNGVAGGDRLNNVEGVVIPAPTPGAYRIHVRAHNIPFESQPFALVVGGPIDSSLPEALVLDINAGISLLEGAAATVHRGVLRAVGADPDRINYTLTTPPTHGALSIAETVLTVGQSFSQADVDIGRLVYTHDGSETLEDRFAFIIADSGGRSLAPATFPITVIPVNDAPSAADDTAETRPGQPVTIDVLANDSDAEGDRLTVVAVHTPSVGTASTDGERVIYIPPPLFVGIARFTYSVSDGSANVSTATVSVLVRFAETSPEPHRIFLPLLSEK